MTRFKKGDRVRVVSGTLAGQLGTYLRLYRGVGLVLIDGATSHFPFLPGELATARGGAGRGQGRKPMIDGEPTTPISIRLSASQRTKLEELGGAEWIRKSIERARVQA